MHTFGSITNHRIKTQLSDCFNWLANLQVCHLSRMLVNQSNNRNLQQLINFIMQSISSLKWMNGWMDGLISYHSLLCAQSVMLCVIELQTKLYGMLDVLDELLNDELLARWHLSIWFFNSLIHCSFFISVNLPAILNVAP